MDEYLDSLENRVEKLRAKTFSPMVAQIVKTALEMAADILPKARASTADIYMSLDGLDRALKQLEDLPHA